MVGPVARVEVTAAASRIDKDSLVLIGSSLRRGPAAATPLPEREESPSWLERFFAELADLGGLRFPGAPLYRCAGSPLLIAVRECGCCAVAACRDGRLGSRDSLS